MILLCLFQERSIFGPKNLLITRIIHEFVLFFQLFKNNNLNEESMAEIEKNVASSEENSDSPSDFAPEMQVKGLKFQSFQSLPASLILKSL
jgi:hypothetical protein